MRTLLDLVCPRECAGCGQTVGSESEHICWECLAGLWPVQFPHCSICGNPVSGMIHHDYVCALCTARKRHFVSARSAVHFDGRIVNIIHAFKYNKAVHLGADLAVLLAACVSTRYMPADTDAVIYVPLHHRKERERGYNQARILASFLAESLDKPLLSGCLVRCRGTASQTALTSGQRRENVRNAFGARNEKWLEGRRLLLVDDVMTTGATVDECARVLRDAGAAAVRVVTVARGC